MQRLNKHFKKDKRRAEKAILRTLAYRSIFNYPLSYYQLSTYLICRKPIDPKTLRQVLFQLVKERKVGVKNNKYYLHKTKPVDWEQKKGYSEDLFEEAENIAEILSKVPWIKFIGVTGSLAAYSPTKDDDMDFFFVTQHKRLWLARGFTFIALKILGALRSDKDPNRKVCPNIFIDETNLSWSKKRRNIYVAHEVAMLRPLFERDQTYFRFMKKNSWIYKHLANLPGRSLKLPERKVRSNFVLNTLEDLAYKTQLAYMKKKKTKEITERDKIHFSKVDNTRTILDNYKKNCVRLGI